MTLTEAVKAMQAGDDSAFPVIYKETSGQAMAVIRRYCSLSADCEDLLQDTYVQVYKYIHQLKDPQGIQGWVNTIAQRIAIAHLKKQKAHPQQSFAEMETEDGQLPEFEDEREDIRPELVADRKAVAEIVNQILALLSPEQRDALMMVYGQKMTIREMAGNLGISENTIKSRLHQGKQKLMSYKADFRRLGVELPVVGIGTVLVVAFEENMAAEAAGLAVSTVAFAGSEAAKGTTASAAAGANAGVASGAAQAATSAASSAAGVSTVAGVSTTSAGASAAGMALGTKALIGVAAAALVAGGGVAVKTLVLDAGTEAAATTETEVAIEESSAAETEAEYNAISEPTDLFECFGMTEDEIIAKYGEPDTYNAFDDIRVKMLTYNADGRTFLLEPEAGTGNETPYYCNIIKYDTLDSLTTEKMDIHDFLDAVNGRIAAYGMLADENDLVNDMPWCGDVGQTELRIVSESNTNYCFYLDDPSVLEPESADFVIAQRGDSAGAYVDYTMRSEEDKTKDFDTYLATMGFHGLMTLSENENTMDVADLAAAYYEMIQSLDESCYAAEHLDQLEWKYVDLDGDGLSEILFASAEYHASPVGVGRIVDGKAVWCGDIGNTGELVYYPGIDKFMTDWTGGGGHDECIYSLEGTELQLEAYAGYSQVLNENDEDELEDFDGELHGAKVSTSEAQSYIDDFKAKNGDGENFYYGDYQNYAYALLATLAERGTA